MTSPRITYGLGSYTPARFDEVRGEVRESLERFELAASEIPLPSIKTEGAIGQDVPLPAKFAFDQFLQILQKNGIGIGTRDDDAYLLTLASGIQFEFWPVTDTSSQLQCNGILSGDDAITGERFRNAVAVIALLLQDIPALLARFAAADRQAAISLLSEAETADLNRAVAILQDAGFEFVFQPTASARFAARVTRAPDLSYSFDNLGRFLAFARNYAQPTGRISHMPTARPVGAKPDAKGTVTVARPGRPKATILLLVLALALFAALMVYPWQQ